MWTKRIKSNGEEDTQVDHRQAPPVYYQSRPRLEIDKNNYSEYLSQMHLQEGDYICFRSSALGDRNCVHVVVKVVKEFDKLPVPETDHQSGHPRCLYLADASTKSSGYQWKRWDSPEYYRKLTEDEVMRLIGKDHDNIQDYIQHLRQTT